MFRVHRSGESDFQYYNDIVEALMMQRMDAEDKAGPGFGVTVSLSHTVFTDTESKPSVNLTMHIISRSNPEQHSRTSVDLFDEEDVYEFEPVTALIEHAIRNTNELMDDAVMMESMLDDATISANVSKIIRENLTLAGVQDNFVINCSLRNHQISFVNVTVK